MNTSNKILITGTAGFIGFHMANRMLSEGYSVVGVDNINEYYDPQLKYDRLKEAGIERAAAEKWHNPVQSTRYEGYRFYRCNLEDRQQISELFKREQFEYVIHLAAQPGVRYSLENPYAYIDSNIAGTLNILEGCRHHPVKHLVYASSSSVYGANTRMPFSVRDNVDHPVSLYAATKKSNELMAHTYSNLYDIPTTGLRFFTVYGPWGRPDMAYFKFTKAILEGRPIDVYNHGEMKRDFTYIDDIVESIKRLLPNVPEPSSDWNGEEPDPARSFCPYRIYNIGNNSPVQLEAFIEAIEAGLSIEARRNYMDLQPGDVPATWADVQELIDLTGFQPQTTVQTGIGEFLEWYKSYYGE